MLTVNHWFQERSFCSYLILVAVFLEITSAIYLPWKEENLKRESVYGNEKEENQVYEYHEASEFRYDEDVLRYLKFAGRGVVIWQCSNALKPYMDRKRAMIPFVDLYCSVMGRIAKVEWHHRHRNIKVKNEYVTHKYKQSARPRQEGGRHFAAWTDFRLRINNVTKTDSGAYLFKAFSQDGQIGRRFIYVDVSTKWNRFRQHRARKQEGQGRNHDHKTHRSLR